MRCCCLLAMILVCATSGYSQQKQVVTPSDIANLKRVEDPRISPDGSMAAYVVTTPVAAGEHQNSHIWVVRTNAPGSQRMFISSGDADTTPRWSPDGQSIAFLSDRKNSLPKQEQGVSRVSLAPAGEKAPTPPEQSDKKEGESPGMQLWTIGMHGGEATPLTNIAGGIKTFAWSRDGKALAFIRTDQDTAQERERKKQKNDQILVDRDYHFDRLWVYDFTQRQAHLVTTGDFNVDDFDFSPSGAQVVARVSPTPRLDDYWRVSKVVIIDLSNGNVARTLEEHSGYASPVWSRDGHRVTFSRMSQKRISDFHVVYDLDSNKPMTVEDQAPGTVEDMRWLPDSRALILTQVLGAHIAISKLNVESGHVTPLEGIAVTASDVNIDDRDGSFVFIGQDPAHSDEVWFYAAGHGIALTETNPQVKNWKLGVQQEIEWKNSKDGKTVHGVLVLPPGYQKGMKYKTVVHIHGGPEEAWTLGFNGNWYNYATLLASNGYVVLLPDPRGSEGADVGFIEANYQDWGNGDFQDIMSGVDSLIAQGITDPNRLVVGGWSYGGYMTAWTVTHTDRFKAGMVGAGITDLYSMAHTTDIAPSYMDSYFGTVEANPKLYDEHSPIRYLEECHTPVLVLHGEADVRVPTYQGQEFYNGLRFRNKEAEMVRYPREPHIFTEREHQIDSLQRILSWYDAHVGR